MSRTVLDVTRLLTRAAHPIATGVDRVELAYARRILAQDEDRVGFAAIVGKSAAPLKFVEVAKFVAALDAKWRRGRPDGSGARLLEERLGARFPSVRRTRPATKRDEAASRAFRLRLMAMASIRGPAARAGDRYVHVSHIRLDRPDVFVRLNAEGARVVMLIHDLIPIRFPEYGRPGEDERHRRRMTTAIEQAEALIANSSDTAADLEAFAREIGRAAPPIVTASLGLEDSFSAEFPALEAAKPYFVALGTIEPRKNHLLLLHVWRRLSERLGPATPGLVVVGRRGWENEMVLDMLERAPQIRAHVVEANDLSDVALASLVKGARALLFPSFAEGYGLPLAEALALGAPVVASDLPAFREIAGKRLDYLDPLDGPAWETAILELSRHASPRRATALARIRGYRAPSWDDHFAMVRHVTGLD